MSQYHNLEKCKNTIWWSSCSSWKQLAHRSFTSLALHYNDALMGAIESQITSLAIVYSTVYSDADQGKHQSSASLAFVRGIHRRPVNSPHKWPVRRKMFPFDDVIMLCGWWIFSPRASNGWSVSMSGRHCGLVIRCIKYIWVGHRRW